MESSRNVSNSFIKCWKVLKGSLEGFGKFWKVLERIAVTYVMLCGLDYKYYSREPCGYSRRVIPIISNTIL